MKKLIKLCLFLFLFINFSCEKNTTSPDYGDVSLNITEHILSGYFVTSIAFDNNGTAWIGTFRQGLIQYDGSATFYTAKNSALPDSMVIRDVAVDKKDNIWFGSDAGLIKYDQKNFIVYNTENSPLMENVVRSIAIDEDNTLWFASCRFRQGGLMKFDGLNWTLFTPENSQLPAHSVRDVIVDRLNNKWIAMSETLNNGYIIKITGNNWTLFDKKDIGFIPYYFGNLAIDYKNNIYASLDYGLSSYWDMTRPNIIRFDGKDWTINNPVDARGESLGYVGKINIDLSGNIWAALNGRKDFVLAVYNGKKWIYNDTSFPIDWISGIAVDRNNTVWLGTGEGVYLIHQ